MSAVAESRVAARGRKPGALARARDLAVGAAALIVAAPVVAVTLALVRLTIGRPVLFRQERIGKDGRPFVLMKIKTMQNPGSNEVGPESDAARLTRLGRALRATSIDELPTLWNVLRGDMSLVGPRPLPTRYLGRYSARQARRHEVRPGITGWTQVKGRNALSWEEKFELDVWYVENRTASLDLRILLRTIARLVAPRGISHAGHPTMPEFDMVNASRDGGTHE